MEVVFGRGGGGVCRPLSRVSPGARLVLKIGEAVFVRGWFAASYLGCVCVGSQDHRRARGVLLLFVCLEPLVGGSLLIFPGVFSKWWLCSLLFLLSGGL